MSYLNGPRINFWGGGSTNVDTANNTGNGIVDLVQTKVIADKTDDELIAFLRQHDTLNGEPYYTIGGWNYYGDHQVAFRGVKVSSAGAPGAVTPADGLANLPVYLLGSVDPLSGAAPQGGPVMVDLDPASTQATQIYAGGLQIGGGDTLALLVRGDTRCHAHFLGLRYAQSSQPPHLTPGSVRANGTFQLAFPREAVVRYDGKKYPTLASIVEAPGAVGIVVRFCMFEFMPGMSTAQVQASYDANYNDANPSLGRIVGTIGPWYPGEPGTCPPGRLLQNANLGGAQGVAYLDAAASRLTLDLSSALQGAAIRTNTADVTSPIGPNVDYGDLRIGTGGKVLAATPSLPDTYYRFGGVYDVKLDAGAVAALAAGPIEITSSLNGLRLAEVPLRIFSDDRNVYLDDVGGATELNLVVRHLGGPVPRDTTLALATGASGTLPAADYLKFPASVVVPAGTDTARIEVSDNGRPAGFVALNVTAAGTRWFTNFRKYPPDDFGKRIAAGPLAWDFVYENTLRYYYVLFPGMSKRIPLDDEASIKATAAEILKRLSPRYHDTTLRMPVTRSMSPGKVALLRAYLQQQAGGG